MVQMETPPLLRGTEQEQLAQLRSYLFQAAQHLNLALNDLSMDSFGKDVQEAIQAGGTQSAEKVQASVDQTASALKDLIIKTANVIYQQMDVLETVLRSEYVAASDFGQYQEEIESRLTQTAENTTAAYDYAAKISADTDARLTELAGDQDALREMLVKSSGYIKQGTRKHSVRQVDPGHHRLQRSGTHHRHCHRAGRKDHREGGGGRADL